MSNPHHYAVIVAGGSGTRLWPLSRKDLPKQVHKLISDKTLIEETVERISHVIPFENIFISTTENYSANIHQILPTIPKNNIIVEPVSRGTTAAFALFCETIARRDPDATVISFASDHAISDVEKFHCAIRDSYDFVEQHPHSIVLIGVVPDRADTGLGYIKIDQRVQEAPDIFSVEKFVEKPSRVVAKRYVNSGQYYWNAAYYCFKAAILTAAYDETDPRIMTAVRTYMSTHVASDFEACPTMPHEIEIINAKRFPLYVLPASFQWSDVGSWGALHDILADLSDETGIVVKNKDQHIDVDSRNVMVMARDTDKIIATVGLQDVIIVDTDDVLLVLDKKHSQDIKKTIEQLRQRGLEQYL